MREALDSLRVLPASVVRYARCARSAAGLGPRVEGGEELAGGDESLGTLFRQDRGTVRLQRDEPVGRSSHHLERVGRHARRVDAAEQVACDVEDRPVVDAENLAPLGQHVGPKQDAVVGYLVEVVYAMLPGHVLVEDQSVDDYRRGHAQRLLAVRLLEQFGYRAFRAFPEVCRLS